MNRQAQRRFLTLLLAVLSGPASAGLDDVQSLLLKPYELRLRWDNVEPTALYWRGGEPPLPDRASERHTVRLAPGQDIWLLIPAGESLRLLGITQPLEAGALDIVSAADGRLFVQQTPAVSLDRRQWLVDTPPVASHLLRIRRPAQSGGPVDLALFVSRREPLGAIAPYRRVWPLPADSVDLRPERAAAGQRYWRIEAGRRMTLELDGPARYALAARLAYPPEAARPQQGWRVRWFVGASEAPAWVQEAGAETAQAVHIDGHATPVSREETGFLELGPGRHQVSIEADAPLLARLLQQEDTDYLLPGPNEPQRPAREVRPVAAPAPGAPADTPAHIEAAAQERMRDNRLREAGLSGSAQLMDLAARRPDDPSIAATAAESRTQSTYFRDLLPTIKAGSGELLFAWYAPARLVATAAHGQGAVLFEQHATARLDGLDSAWFLPLPRGLAEPEIIRSRGAERQISFDGDLLFDSASARLRAEGEASLQRLASLLRGAEARDIRITGHTDDQGGIAYNQALSERRAGAVAQFLNLQGIDPARIQAAGAGELAPRSSNASPEGRQSNRRVEIRYRSEEAGTTRLVAQRQSYVLPERPAPSTLRVVLHTDAAARATPVYVQFDDAAPRRLAAEAFSGLSGDDLVPSSGLAALAWQARRHGPAGGDTLSGAFALTRPTGPLVTAGVADLDLPRSVRVVTVWRDATAAGDARLALKLRTGKTWQMSEQTYLEAAASRPPLATFVAALDPAVPPHPLLQHWQPALRSLREQAAAFCADTARPGPGPALPGDAQPFRDEMQRLKAQGEWLPALEAAADALPRSRAAGRDEIGWARIEWLEQAGESQLARQLLRQSLCFGPDDGARQRAQHLLEARAQEEQDIDAMAAAQAAGFVTRARAGSVDVPTLQRLAQTLQNRGEPALALQLGLLLPDGPDSVATRLRSSLELQWWQVFARDVAMLPPDQRNDWIGQQLAAFGHLDDALGHLRQGSAAGRARAAHLEQGQALLQRRDSGGDARLASDWAEWFARTPGPQRWQTPPDLVVDAAGSEGLYAVARDLHAPAWRASASRPVVLRFHGPARLRIGVRPLLPAQGRQPVDGWARIRHADPARPQWWVLPYTRVTPAPGLALNGQPEWRVGHLTRREIAFGPGLHELQVDGLGQPLLVEAERLMPEQPAPVLPPPTPATLQAGPAPAPPPEQDEACRSPCVTVVPAQLGQPVLRWSAAALAGPERLATLSREAAPAGMDAEAHQLARGDWDALLARPPAGDGEALRARMGLLLWLAEQEPAHYARVLAIGLDLARQHPQVAGLPAMLERLTRQSGWVPWLTVAESAGLRPVEMDRWTPESPALRARRALLAPAAANEYLLSGSGELVLSLFNPNPARMALVLGVEDVPGWLPEAMDLLVSIDDAAPQVETFAPGAAPRSLVLDLPAGRHAVRIAARSPLLGNQFVRIRLDTPADGTVQARQERLYHVARPEAPVQVQLPGPGWLRIDEWRDGRVLSRYQHLAAPWQEVRLQPEPGRKEALYRLHLRQPQVAPAEPPARTARHVPVPVPFAPETPDGPPARLQVHFDDGLPLQGQEDGTWSFGLTWRQRPYGIDDPAIAGRVDVALQNVPAGDPAQQAAAGAWRDYLLGRREERFLEASATWRHFSPERLYFREAGVLLRQREQGGQTLGAHALAEFRPRWTPWTLTTELRGFVQDLHGRAETLPVPDALAGLVGDGSPEATPGGLEWSWEWRTALHQRRDIDPKTFHTPRLTALLRRSSLQGTSLYRPPYRSGLLDQDVYTLYRSQHERSLELADTLHHRPWLDTWWYAGAGIATGEDLNPLAPDHLAVNLGWRQRIGGVVLDLEWRNTRYFAGDSRESGFGRNRLKLDAGWEIWREQRDRIEWGLSMQYDPDRRQFSLGLGITWHWGQGRDYRDFRFGDTEFRDLRERDLPNTPNNHWREQP